MGKKTTTTSEHSGKYAVYEFNDEEEQNEKKSHEFLKKFNPNNNKLPLNLPSLKFNHDHPIDKYEQLIVQQYFKQHNTNSWKDTSPEPVDIGATKDSVKGHASGFKVGAVCSSSKYETDVHVCSNDCDTRDVLCETNSFVVRDTQVGVDFGSINLKENPRHNLLSDNEPIGITSDDNDSIESMSSLISKSFGENTKDLLEEQLLTSGTDECEFDKSVVVYPDHILYGDMVFWSSKLIFTRNYIQFDDTSLFPRKDCLRFEYAVDDISSVESYWSNKLFIALVHICLKSKHMKVAINAEEPDTVVLKFAVTDRNWSKIEDNIKALDVRYKETWHTTYHDAAMTEDVSVTKLSEDHCVDHDQHFEEVVYPKGDHDAISICKRDIQLLQPERFINDTIIDFYMKYLKNKLKTEEMHRFHLFNSFFFRKLVDLDKERSKAHEGNIAFERVRKWTRKVNLFEKDYIFIPVNFRFHWSLVVICHPGEVVTHKDKKEALLKVPCILHMDSIKGSHRGLKNLFQSYLLEEWKERHKELVDDVSSRFGNLPFLDLELPQQENSFDCGIFLLHYVELFLQNAPANFNPSMISKSDKFLNKDWFSPAEASSKRAHIRELLYKIAEDNSHLVSASNERDSSESGGICESLNGRVCVYDTCNSADTCLERDSNYTADEEFNYTPVAGKHLLSVKWYGEANALSDPRNNVISLNLGDYHPQRQMVLYNQPRISMSPIEECEESYDPTSAASYRAKELETIQLQLPLENYIISEEVKKKSGTISLCESKPLSELRQGGYHRPELQRLDNEKDKDIHECSSSTNDDCTDCVVEDSEEIIEAQDANERQNSFNQTDICASPDQEADSVAVTCHQTEQMPSNVHAAFVVSDSDDELLELPGISVKPGVSSHQGDYTIVLHNRRADLIEITDSSDAHSPVSEIKEQRGAKRPRSMSVGEESPLAKRLQMITID